MNKSAQTHFPIDERLARRWSPYVFSERPVSAETLRSILEAARWAPSSFNEQPWRFVVGMKGHGETHARIVDCLAEGNRTWAAQAPVLILGIYKYGFSANDKPNKSAPHDLGLAFAQMIFEAGRHELFAHMMIGLDPELARTTFAIPNDAEAYTAMAIGQRDTGEAGDSTLRVRENKARQRLAQREFVFSNRFGESADF